MTTTIVASLDTTDLLRIAAQLGLSSKELNKAAVTAVNDTAKRTRSEARRQIRAYLTLPARSINRRVELGKRATPDDLTATVRLDRVDRREGGGASARPTLMSFKGKPNKPRSESKRTKTGKLTKAARAPFTYQITKTGGRRMRPGMFVQRQTTTGLAMAFKRVGKNRYPLWVPRGPSIAAVWQFDQNKVADKTLADLRGALTQRMLGQGRRQLARTFKAVAA